MRVLRFAVVLCACRAENPGFLLSSSDSGQDEGDMLVLTEGSSTGQRVDSETSESSESIGAQTDSSEGSSGTATTSTDTGSTTIADSSSEASTGMSAPACATPLDCGAGQYCDFPDSDPCGTNGTPGVCKSSPNPLTCTNSGPSVMGCDCTTQWGSECFANAAGFDVACSGDGACGC